jgi:hypothetical protein
MQAHGPLSPALLRVGGSAGRARHARPARTVRNLAIRGMIVLALAISSLALLAWSAHGSAHTGHHRAVVATHHLPRPWML